jgi:hypothetical protein
LQISLDRKTFSQLKDAEKGDSLLKKFKDKCWPKSKDTVFEDGEGGNE